MRIRLFLIGVMVLWGCGRAERQQARPMSTDAATDVKPEQVQAESEPNQPPQDSVQPEPESEAATFDDPNQLSFWSQAQRLYDQAKESGSTTASSAAVWVAELYDKTAAGTQNTARSSADWVSEKYREALAAGDTTAASTKDWVMDDLGKIGTWSYKVVEIDSRIPDRMEQELNRLGAQRWECFTVRPDAERTILYLKRPHRSYLRHLPAKDLLRLVPLLQGEHDSTE